MDGRSGDGSMDGRSGDGSMDGRSGDGSMDGRSDGNGGSRSRRALLRMLMPVDLRL
jgi:hypothetical protein